MRFIMHNCGFLACWPCQVEAGSEMDSVNALFTEVDQLELLNYDLCVGDCGIFCSPVINNRNPFPARIISIVRERKGKQLQGRNIYFVINLYLQESPIVSFQHLYATEKLFVVHSSSFVQKIWILPYWDSLSGMYPVEMNFKGAVQNVFYFGLVIPLSKLESTHNLSVNRDGVYNVVPEMLGSFIPEEFQPPLVKITNLTPDSVKVIQESVSKIKSFPSLPLNYYFPCAKCRYTAEKISTVAFHYLSHFNFNGLQITESTPINLVKGFIPTPKDDSNMPLGGLQRADYPRSSTSLIDNSADVTAKYQNNFQCNSDGNIMWFNTPPLFIPFSKKRFPSIDYLLFREKNPKKFEQKRIVKMTSSNEIKIPSTTELEGN